MTAPAPTAEPAELPGPDAALYGSTVEVARWLAFVGLRGRFAVAPDRTVWRWWPDTGWQVSDVNVLTQAIRRAIGAFYDQRMDAGPSDTETLALVRLMDVNFALGRLLPALVHELRVERERLYVRKALSPEDHVPGPLGPAPDQVECSCGQNVGLVGIGSHLRANPTHYRTTRPASDSGTPTRPACPAGSAADSREGSAGPSDP